jgi:exodeoxyribonuclease VII large subunit
MMKIYSVTEINNYIKLLLLKDNVLSCVKISGEVSNCKYHSSGHIYFTLKYSSGQIACVMFAGKRIAGLKFNMTEGMSVVVTGQISVYERDGKYQLYADRIEQQGIGELYERFEKLKEKLMKEGLFDSDHKKPLPPFISTLGVITAPDGAAVQDIINITKRRNPHVKIVIYPARVQGAGAAKTLIAGIKAMEHIRPDVIIIGRGGGSFEDLFEFNDEELARAVYDCTIPVISAVGHEVDFSICDYVSDMRAPTPSAGAELAVYEYDALEASFDEYKRRLKNILTNRIALERSRSEQYRLRLLKLSPKSIVNNYIFRADKLKDSLDRAFTGKLENTKHRLAVLATSLDQLSPLKSLTRGYSYTTDAEGRNINSTEGLKLGDSINVRVKDGTITAGVTDIKQQITE